jgi:hypothetical protein
MKRVGGPMRDAISGWLKRNGASGRNESQKKGLSAVQRKRKKLSTMIEPK